MDAFLLILQIFLLINVMNALRNCCVAARKAEMESEKRRLRQRAAEQANRLLKYVVVNISRE